MTLGPELYVCSSCGKEKDYLSDSWHRVELAVMELPEPQYLYFCLECMSNKKERRGPVQ